MDCGTDLRTFQCRADPAQPTTRQDVKLKLIEDLLSDKDEHIAGLLPFRKPGCPIDLEETQYGP